LFVKAFENRRFFFKTKSTEIMCIYLFCVNIGKRRNKTKKEEKKAMEGYNLFCYVLNYQC